MINFLMAEDIGKAFVPKRFRPDLRSYFLKAGVTDVPYHTFGMIFWFSVLLMGILYATIIYPFAYSFWPNAIFFFAITAVGWAAIHIALAFVLILGIYFYIDLMIFNRTAEMEAVLPDFLRYVAENLRGGMPFERALWSAIKPEFSILASEVRLAAKKVMTGQDVDEALREFTGKYESPMLRRSFDLIIESLQGGGEISEMIYKIVENLEETRELKEEMSATNLTYVIFITFMVLVITPVLFTLSYQFILIIKNFSAQLGSQTQTVNFPIQFGKSNFDPQLFVTFSRLSIATSAFFSSMVVSMINTGSIKGGLKYIPIFVIGSLLMYTLLMAIATKIFAGLAFGG